MPKLSSDTKNGVRLFLYFFFLLASNTAVRTSRDTFLLQGSYARYLPYLIAGTAVVMYLIVRLQTLIARGGNPVYVAAITATLSAISYPVFSLFDMTGLASVFYFMWTEAVGSLLGVQFWIVAAAVIDARTGKKLFGIIGSGGAIGGLVAGVFLIFFSRRYGVGFLPMISSLLLFAAIFFCATLSRGRSDQTVDRHNDQQGASEWNLSHPYIRAITLMLIPAALGATLIDYNFKITAAAALPDSARLAAYFSWYYAAAGALTLAFQIFLTSFFLTKLGLLVSLLLLPVLLTFLLAPMPALSLTAGLQALPMLLYLSFAGRLADQSIKFTIYQSAFQLLWLPVPALRKAILKLSVEGVLKNGISGLAGLAIALAAAFYPPKGESFIFLQALISAGALACALFWLFAAVKARRSYKVYLIRSLENRLADFSAESIEINSPEIREMVRGALLSGQEGAVAFALDILSGQSLSGWEADLQAIFLSSSQLIQERILELARRESTLLQKDFIIELTRSRSQLRYSAQVLAARRNYTELVPYFAGVRQLSDYAGFIARGCLALSAGPNSAAGREFNALLLASDTRQRLEALRAAVFFPELVDIHILKKNLLDAQAEIRRLALEIARTFSDVGLIADLLPSLGDAKTYNAAKTALAMYRAEDISAELGRLGILRQSDGDLTRGIFRMLEDYKTVETVQLILAHMHTGDSAVFAAGSEVLGKLLPQIEITPLVHAKVDQKISESAAAYFSTLKLLRSGDDADQTEMDLVRDWLNRRLNDYVLGACRLFVGMYGLTGIENRFEGRHLRTDKRSEFLELIENSAKPPVKGLLIALLDSRTDEILLTRLGTFFPKARNIVAEWWNSGLEWPMAMSLLIHFSRNPTDMQSWDKFAERSLPPLPREILLRKIHLLKVDTSRKSLKKIMSNEVNLTMYPTLEKILLLKSIDMFRDISAEDVSRLIQISREIDIGANTAIFHEGDEGHELFILLNGQIRIHHNERELAVLKRGDFLGEMALLDNEPRSADAVTLSDCKLLSIGQSDFFDVLSGRPEILKGILRLLSRRQRNTISNVS